jgi:hypothetical protein
MYRAATICSQYVIPALPPCCTPELAAVSAQVALTYIGALMQRAFVAIHEAKMLYRFEQLLLQ